MQNFVEILKKHYTGNEESMETTLHHLKLAGCTQLQTTMLLCQQLGLSVFDADRIVLYSKAWESELAGNINLRNEFDQLLKSDDNSPTGENSEPNM